MSDSARPTTRLVLRRWLMAAAAWIWEWRQRPWLAVAAGLLAIMLALAGWLLPQLPGQFVDEQAAAATWLVTTSTNYGIWGNALLGLGLFDVLRSPLLFLLLALLIPTLATQLADQLGALRQQRQLRDRVLTLPTHNTGDVLPISRARPVFRWRGQVSASPTAALELLTSVVQEDFKRIDRAQLAIITPLTVATEDSTPVQAIEPTQTEPTQELSEERLLGIQRPHLQLIRPLLMVGLLTCVAGAWIALAFGWHITPPPLAPGAVFRSANRNLVLHYSVPPTTTQSAALDARLQGTRLALPVALQPGVNQARIGPATLSVRPIFPAVWIATDDGSEQLTLPGESKMRSTIGLVFANSGSEESVLIPEQRAGLRVVQRAGTSEFVLELYRSDTVQPIYRGELTPGGRLTIPLTEATTQIIVSSLPGLQVDVRNLPGLWLVPLGVLLALIGASAYFRQSGFVLVQVAPWGDEISSAESSSTETSGNQKSSSENCVVVLQSDHAATITKLQDALATFSAPTGLKGAADEVEATASAPSAS